jgi:hypothetical protein
MINILHLLHVSATHVAILMEVRDNTKACESMHTFLSCQDGDALHTTCLYHSIHTRISHTSLSVSYNVF